MRRLRLWSRVECLTVVALNLKPLTVEGLGLVNRRGLRFQEFSGLKRHGFLSTSSLQHLRDELLKIHL